MRDYFGLFLLIGVVLIDRLHRLDKALHEHIEMQREVWTRQGIDVRRLKEDFREPSIWESWPNMTWEARFGYLLWKIVFCGLIVFVIYSYYSH